MTTFAPFNLLFGLSALAAMVPAAVLALRHGPVRGLLFWALAAVAVAGPSVFALAQLGQGSLPNLSTALWLSVSASLIVFVATALVSPPARRLTPILMPYLLFMGTGALIASGARSHELVVAVPAAWLDAHVVVSLATYGLLTLAAVAGFAVLLQEGALKRKQPTSLTRALPSVADGEDLQVRLLVAAEAVLGAGMLTGMAAEYVATGRLLSFDHKTLLSFLAFGLIAVLLLVHYRSGLRGRRAARVVLVAYLLLTLAYPGVKFVTDVLLA